MKTKMLIIVFVSLFLSVGIAHAQTKSFSYYAKETLDAIGASPQQQEKIKEIHNNTNAQIREVKKDTKLTEDEKKEKYKGIYGEGAKLYNEVLTKEQQDKLKQLYKEFKESNK